MTIGYQRNKAGPFFVVNTAYVLSSGSLRAPKLLLYMHVAYALLDTYN